MVETEKATLRIGSSSRSVPAWALSAIADQRAAAALIADPVKRRIAEIEIDERAERIETEFREGGGTNVFNA